MYDSVNHVYVVLEKDVDGYVKNANESYLRILMKSNDTKLKQDAYEQLLVQYQMLENLGLMTVELHKKLHKWASDNIIKYI